MDRMTNRMTKGERTALRILDAAETLFAERGYAGASLREIAARAKIQQPGLYNYFESKEALYRAVLTRGVGPFAEIMDEMVGNEIGPRDMAELGGRMTEVLATRPAVASLLMRAVQAAGGREGKDRGTQVAFEILQQLMAYGRKVNEAAGFPRSETELLLYQVALFNMTCGYFWGSSLVEALLGKDVLSPALLETQKRLLTAASAALTSAER